jgi:hypothetical protein
MNTILGMGNSSIDFTQPNLSGFKKGETYEVFIGERLSDKEAIVRIKGENVRVNFENGVPKEEKAFIRITDINSQQIEAKVVNPQAKELQQTILKNQEQFSEAIKMLSNSNIPIDSENIKAVKDFMNKAHGSYKEKLDTIKALLRKNIKITAENLKAVHEALHGEKLNNLLMELIKNLDLKTEIFNSVDGFGFNNEGYSSQVEDFIRNIFDKEDALIEQDSTDEELQIDSSNEEVEILKNIAKGETGQVLANMDLAVKNFVVTRITKEMALAADNFKNLKREIIRNIDDMIYSLEESKLEHIKGTLENTINTLDRAILKSKIMLFTDMRTERELLVASSKLADARKLLAMGKNSEAKEILNEVKESLAKLNWKPSEKKVMHLVVREEIHNKTNNPENRLTSYINEIIQKPSQRGGAARNTYELLKRLGLNHDSEVAQHLTSNSNEFSKEDLQRNMKSIIMELIKGSLKNNMDFNGKLQKIIDNVTGQQILNQREGSQFHQSMFLNIPVNLGGRIENLKLFINSKKEREKIDWQNSTLYFLVETRKLGETGILLSSVDRKLSITIKNDRNDLKEELRPYIDRLKETLNSIGYNVVSCNFTKLNEANKEVKEENKSKSLEIQREYNKKGFDYRV